MLPDYDRAQCTRKVREIRQEIPSISAERVRGLAKDQSAVSEAIRFMGGVGALLTEAEARIPDLYPGHLPAMEAALASLASGIRSLTLQMKLGIVLEQGVFLCDAKLREFLKEERPVIPDIGTITAAIAAATSAVGLVDKVADQIERFLTKKPTPAVPVEHRAKIEGNANTIVAKRDGQVVQTITVDDMSKLPEAMLRHIRVLEQSMDNHYSVWASAYPQLALAVDPVAKAKIEQQLKGIIREMRSDLDGILAFLESSGIHLDDHYQHIRSLVLKAG